MSEIVALGTGAALLELARESVVAWTRGQPPAPRPVPGGERRAGAFVSLYRRGELRGCMGHVEDDTAVQEVVAAMAVAAARDDPRFPPLAEDELDGLDVGISVLSPCAPARPEDVVPGRDGVIVKRGRQQGVFLPQVASEQGWARDTLLAMVCRKAGLSADAWRDQRTALFIFQAQVFPADPA